MRRRFRFWLPLLVLAIVGCSPGQLKTANDVLSVADDVMKVARVLCLQSHARASKVRASLLPGEVCKTAEELAPVLDQTRGVIPQAACAPVAK